MGVESVGDCMSRPGSVVFVVCVTGCLAQTDGHTLTGLDCEVRTGVKEGGFLASR